MREKYIPEIYAGWLAKVIGVQAGSPIEGWTHEDILGTYGEVSSFIRDYNEYASDDDTNCPFFFARAFRERRGHEFTSQDVADALVNYSPYGHGFIWWGGVGVSIEQTVYENVRKGMKAPYCGSMEVNGADSAMQIGGQIFIECWGLINPGKPGRAAKMAETAARAMYDKDAVYGGIFFAAMEAAAFEEKDIHKLIEIGLTFIPSDCHYAKIVRLVKELYRDDPKDWRKAFRFIQEHHGYDRYPGICNIYSNTAVDIIALLYGEGDFTKSLSIALTAGWDVDCNAGNVACLMGIRNGIEGIDYLRWIKPVHDHIGFSSVLGSMNMIDVPESALYFASLAYEADGEKMPEKWQKLLEKKHAWHFEFPYSTHALKTRMEDADGNPKKEPAEPFLRNVKGVSKTGERSLQCVFKPILPGETCYVFARSFYDVEDLSDARTDPDFSPVVYPGETIRGTCMRSELGGNIKASLYVRDKKTGKCFFSEPVRLREGKWEDLVFTIPASDSILCEMGFAFELESFHGIDEVVSVYLDSFEVETTPNYLISMQEEKEQHYPYSHSSFTQFTRLQGEWEKSENGLRVVSEDLAEIYTGDYLFEDYRVRCMMTPETKGEYRVNIRVQGAMRSYAAALLPEGRFGIVKKDKTYTVLSEVPFAWEAGKCYTIEVEANKNRLSAAVEGVSITAVDDENPYLYGAFGVSVGERALVDIDSFEIKAIQ